MATSLRASEHMKSSCGRGYRREPRNPTGASCVVWMTYGSTSMGRVFSDVSRNCGENSSKRSCRACLYCNGMLERATQSPTSIRNAVSVIGSRDHGGMAVFTVSQSCASGSSARWWCDTDEMSGGGTPVA